MSTATVRRAVRRVAMRRVTGPDEYGSTYVYFRRNAGKLRTLKHLGLVNLDFNQRGELVGIELLAVPWRLPK